VSEQQQVVTELARAGVLAGVRWAYLSATTRSLETYSEADGLDTAWLGHTRFTLFRNRLDRVFACDRYAVHTGDGEADLDVLYEQLSEHDVHTMPRVAPGLMRRANLNGSPGWALGQRRFLLASCEFGKLDQLPWPQKSLTKQRVALQRNPAPPQPSLFDGFAPEEVGGLAMALAGEPELDLTTYVVAHSLDPLGQHTELALGRPRLNAGGGPAWHWREDLLDAAPAGGGRRAGASQPRPSRGQDPMPDAPVRLRERPGSRHSGQSERRDGRASGER
jgi:hypothetical protein